MTKLACVVGARPNFMKMAPLLRALDRYPEIEAVLVHTGQHYDEALSDVFFCDLAMRRPDVCLEAGSGSQAVQTARVLERFEAVLQRPSDSAQPFDRVVVVGDVNSTMAASLAAVKLGIPVAHVEAGLRSFDRSMPEEINRVVTDAVSDMLFVSEPAGVENLRREGVPEDRVHLVGNVMIDTLKSLLPKAQSRDTLGRLGIRPHGYGVLTLHRPSNVDDPAVLRDLIEVILDVSREMPWIFPVHPRTAGRLEQSGLNGRILATPHFHAIEPLGYLDFLALTSQARVVVTDSGGLQEESCALGIPCLTARWNTERPITVAEGTSTLVGNDPANLRGGLQSVFDGTYKRGRCPALWDGHAATRIAAILAGARPSRDGRPARLTVAQA
jgi:UDP-N-acetylglucosamine 2-epimerase (non-hydrolysing)